MDWGLPVHGFASLIWSQSITLIAWSNDSIDMEMEDDSGYDLDSDNKDGAAQQIHNLIG